MDINDNIVIKEDKVFNGSCDLCMEEFSSYDKLKIHKKCVHEQLICNESGSRNMQLHSNNHKKLTCPDFNYNYKNKNMKNLIGAFK